MSGLVEGQRALVVGVANKRSIAWSIARALDAQGARVALTYQNERTERDVRRLADELSGDTLVVPLDVQDDAQMDAAFDAAAVAAWGPRHPRARGGLCASRGPDRPLHRDLARRASRSRWTSRRTR